MRTLGYVICPKCQDLMRTITRGAVHIEQCDNCKGVFLDGGELEQILAAEREHYDRVPPYSPQATPDGAPQPYVPQSAPDAPPADAPPPYAPQPGGGGAPPPYQPPPGTPPPGTPAVPPGYPQPYPPGYYPGHYPPRRRSFLEELLD